MTFAVPNPDLVTAEDDDYTSAAATTTTAAASTSSSSASDPEVEAPRLVMAWRHYLQPTTTKSDSIDTTTSSGNADPTPLSLSSSSPSSTPFIRLILASSSPRRREILDMMGLAGRYQGMHSPLNETALQQQIVVVDTKTSSYTNRNNKISIDHEATSFRVQDVKAYTKILAREKARALVMSLIQNHDQDGTHCVTTNDDTMHMLILGSDTVVEWNGCILEKPNNKQVSFRMLQQLSGQTHAVHTAVALYRLDHYCGNNNNKSNNSIDSQFELISNWVDTATVQFTTLTHNDIHTYIDTGEPMDKAGSYGIQGMGGQMIQSVHGDFFTVMGLPMHQTSQTLAQAIAHLVKQQQQQQEQEQLR